MLTVINFFAFSFSKLITTVLSWLLVDKLNMNLQSIMLNMYSSVEFKLESIFSLIVYPFILNTGNPWTDSSQYIKEDSSSGYKRI